MASDNGPPSAKPFIDQIELAERQLTDYNKFFTKVRDRLIRTKKALASKPAVVSNVSTLISDLRAIAADPEKPDLRHLAESLQKQLDGHSQRIKESFPADLRKACDEVRLQFAALPEGFGVGPFYVTLNVPKEVASFNYAKVQISNQVALDATAIATNAISLKHSLLDAPVDLGKFSLELHEAMRVAVARDEKKTPQSELRVDLPVVFRELAVIRRPVDAGPKPKGGVPDYTVVRFVIELAQFVKSDKNVRGNQQFRLEPAVIEHTKNPKKSIFIPHDLSCGYGEGTYFQAIILRRQ